MFTITLTGVVPRPNGGSQLLLSSYHHLSIATKISKCNIDLSLFYNEHCLHFVQAVAKAQQQVKDFEAQGSQALIDTRAKQACYSLGL